MIRNKKVILLKQCSKCEIISYYDSKEKNCVHCGGKLKTLYSFEKNRHEIKY